MRAFAFLLLCKFDTIFKVFLLYLQIRVFYYFKTDKTAMKIYFEDEEMIVAVNAIYVIA